MNARELLKEARDELGAVQYYIPPADETVEMTPAITADVDACQRLAERIDAYLAEPEPDVELVPDMEYGFVAQYGSLTADGKTKDEAMQELARVILAAFNSAPEPDAMEIVRQARDGSLKGLTWSYKQSTSEAAALIESYGRRVPRAMLDKYAELYFQSYDLRIDKDGLQKRTMDAIAAKYGVKVDG